MIRSHGTRHLLIAAVVSAGLMLSACGSAAESGGDADPASGPDAEQLITEVVVSNQTELDDPVIQCQETVTEDFADRLYGGVDRCLQAIAEQSATRTPADDVEVGTVEVKGDRASAEVKVVGGARDSVQGAVELAESEGTWLVDDVNGDYAATAVEAAVTRDAKTQSVGEDDIACVLSVLGPFLRSEDSAKELFYGLNVGEEKSFTLLTSSGELCTPAKLGEAGSPQRNDFEKRLNAEFTTVGGLSERRSGCVLGVLREALTDAEVQTYLQDQDAGGSGTQPVREKIQDALDLCTNVP